MKALLLLLPAMLAFALASVVAGGGDITPPVLVDASADRLRIDTSGGAQSVTFTMHITDDLAGVSHAHVGFHHEHGFNTSRECQRSADPPSRDALLTCTVTWPQYSAEGRWLVTWFRLTDGVGNGGDGNVADCEQHVDGRCVQYVYNERATPAIRSMEIQIGALAVDLPVYLPLIIAP